MRLRWRMAFAVFDAVGSLLFRLARMFRRQPKSATLDRKQVQRILLVQLDHMGDAVITLRSLHALRHNYPGAAIDVLCSPWTAELFDASRDVSRVFVSHNNRFCRPRQATWWWSTGLWGLRLRRQRYDVAFDVRGEAPIAALLWLTGARHRVGWHCGGGGFFLTHGPTYVQNRPELRSRLALWSAVRREDWDSFKATRAQENLEWNLQIRDSVYHKIQRELNTLPHPSHPLVVLHLGAGTMAKRWPVERWRLLIAELLRTLQCTVVLIGSPEEQRLAASVMHAYQDPKIADWTGRHDLLELAVLLDRSDLFIGADSGPAHLAAAVQTPAVVLFSGTNNAQQWRPEGDHVRVVSRQVACSPCHRSTCAWSDHPCMTGISPRQVLVAAHTLLNAYFRSRGLAEEDGVSHGHHSNSPARQHEPV